MKFARLLTAVAMILGLVGCGGLESDPDIITQQSKSAVRVQDCSSDGTLCIIMCDGGGSCNPCNPPGQISGVTYYCCGDCSSVWESGL